MMRISIVTPSLNQGRFIQDALESVRTQEYGDVEHLVYDGGSCDETVSILRSHSGQQEWSHLRWQSRPDGGQSEALNRGFDEARGEIVGWLNADDRYADGCFAHVARAFLQDPALDVLYGDLAEVDEHGRPIRVRREIGFSRFVLYYHHVLYIPTPTAFYRRRVFENGNRLRPDLHYAMDYEFFLRLAAKGYCIRHTPRVLAEFRRHSQSKSCRMVAAQAREKREIQCSLSPIVSRLNPNVRDIALPMLALAAAGARRMRKAIRGDYFTSGPALEEKGEG